MDIMGKEQKVYEGVIIDVYRKQFENINAEILKHPGGVVIAAETAEGKFFMVEQFRFAMEENLLEFPAGKIDPGEKPETTALRELREETGYQAQSIEYIGKTYPSPAYLDEVLYLYYAKDLEFVGQDLDENEELDVKLFDLETIQKMIDEGDIVDSKTIALAYHLQRKHKKTT